MYLPLKIASSSKGRPAKKLGIWLGTIERTEGILIGTTRGVVKCRTVSRLSEDDRWNGELIDNMLGVPCRPAPHRDGQHIPVDINVHGDVQDETEENEEPPKEDIEADDADLEYQRRTHNLHVSRKAIQKYGTTEGCPACSVINRRGHLIGKIRYNHNTACRTRILEAMQEDPEYRRLAHKHTPQPQMRDVEALTEEQVAEKKHNLIRAIASIEQRERRDRGHLGQQLSHTMVKNLIAKMEVAEVYSPPGVTRMAERMGLRVGWALDLTTCDEDGRRWDSDQLETRNRAVRKCIKDQPTLLIGSPMCTASSQTNNINHCKMEALEVERRLAHGRKHLEFCAKFYDIQWSAGRYFLHEHPAGAKAWQEPCMVKLLKKHDVTRGVGDQCCYGLTAIEKGKVWLARKATGFMTNAPCVAQQLNKRCPNGKAWQVHEHIRLECGRTKAAQVYPKALCEAICNGLERHLQVDGDGPYLLASVETAASTPPQ